MASIKEVDLFIFKFNQLWKNGFAADLNFKCYARQAYVQLQVGLGFIENDFSCGSQDSKPQQKHVTPSQQRRRVRRENARKSNDFNSAEKADNLLLQKSVIKTV